MKTIILFLFITTFSYSQEIKTGYELVSKEQCIILRDLNKECDSIKQYDIKLARDLKNKKIYYEKDYFFESNIGTSKTFDILKHSQDEKILRIEIKPKRKKSQDDIIMVVFKNDETSFDIYFRNGVIYRCKV